MAGGHGAAVRGHTTLVRVLSPCALLHNKVFVSLGRYKGTNALTIIDLSKSAFTVFVRAALLDDVIKEQK